MATRPSHTSSPRRPRTPRPAPASPEAAPDALFFRHLVANMRNGVLALGRAGEIVIINGEARRIFGLPPDEVFAGQAYTRVLHNHPDILRVVGGAFEVAALPNRAELRLKPSGTVIGYTLSLVRDAGGEIIGAAMFFKDLTHVEQLEERERLRDRLAAVGEMAATMAHEIKNPLAGIEVLAGLLRRQVSENAAAVALVGDVINEAKMANAIVQEVLEFVRPVRLQLETTSLGAALQTAMAVAEAKAVRGDVGVRLAIPPDIPSITADHLQLAQVFANLLTNAYEALDGRGAIAVSARLAVDLDAGALAPDGLRPVPSVIVDVADDGPGIAPGVVDHLFDPFFTTKPQGSGLGLAIVRKIVDAHEGRIDVRRPSERGTCFRVTLPVSGAADWVQQAQD